jgi:hypothetical protein
LEVKRQDELPPAKPALGFIAPFGRRKKGNVISEIISAAGSHLPTDACKPLECSYRVFRRMLDRDLVRTMFVARAQVFGELGDLMIEIYRGYQQSRDETSLLFYRESSLIPVSVIGRGKGYDFVHIVRGAEPNRCSKQSRVAYSGVARELLS